jgi:hypothetical protein
MYYISPHVLFLSVPCLDRRTEHSCQSLRFFVFLRDFDLSFRSNMMVARTVGHQSPLPLMALQLQPLFRMR